MDKRVKVLKTAKNVIQETDVVESVLARLANVVKLFITHNFNSLMLSPRHFLTNKWYSFRRILTFAIEKTVLCFYDVGLVDRTDATIY